MVTIPTLPEPVIPREPPAPKLELPNVIVMTPEDASYFAEACDAISAVDPSDRTKLEQVRAQYPGLEREDACRWAIYGFTVQDWLTVEAQMAEIASYVEQLRAQIHFLSELMHARQRAINERTQLLQEAGTTPSQ
ncbi:MAG: hypothetical protein ETSY1_30085 [Candidatus Entotheonella factor]|uniref:Uncharacterized protein n=1 Tax=Entotheonella factor TaxID=1429438 RepID=W4LE04_ENTF1|nr:MAG: hypothetical protein ETSY1_30085 [Candidatus Entotheonella factor]